MNRTISEAHPAEGGIPFREKSAWVALAAMAVAYFIAMALAQRSGEEDTLLFLGYFAIASGVRLLILLIGTFAIAARSRSEARGPADERDRAIARRSATKAYYLLMAGMIMVGIVMPFSYRGWSITNAALLALVIADMVRYGAIIVDYRRGWHG
jgi:hypothetical protein